MMVHAAAGLIQDEHGALHLAFEQQIAFGQIQGFHRQRASQDFPAGPRHSDQQARDVLA